VPVRANLMIERLSPLRLRSESDRPYTQSESALRGKGLLTPATSSAFSSQPRTSLLQLRILLLWQRALFSIDREKGTLCYYAAFVEIFCLQITLPWYIHAGALVDTSLSAKAESVSYSFNAKQSFWGTTLLSQRASQNYAPLVLDFSCYSRLAVLEVRRDDRA
jgi:hypothetical protein